MTDGPAGPRPAPPPACGPGGRSWENVAAEVVRLPRRARRDRRLARGGATGSDYPLANPAEITALLEAHRDESFLIAHPLPHAAWGASGGVARMRYRHWAWRKHMLRLPIPRRVPRDVVFAGGSQLKVLARQHAAAVVDVVDTASRPRPLLASHLDRRRDLRPVGAELAGAAPRASPRSTSPHAAVVDRVGRHRR